VHEAVIVAAISGPNALVIVDPDHQPLPSNR
jgi:hypothetical protein